MVIVQHCPDSVKQYAEAYLRHRFAVPRRCPACRALDCLIRWGTYGRWARTDDGDYHILVQRVRCKACGRTHSLLPDFLHPYRQYAVPVLQHTLSLCLIEGLGWGTLMEQLPGSGPGRSTVREWRDSFAYAAGELLLDCQRRQLKALDPLTAPPDAAPPHHLDWVPDPTKQRRLRSAHRFWLQAEHLCALIETRQPHQHSAADQLFPFLLHWLQSQALPPRLFWNPALPTAPSTPF